MNINTAYACTILGKMHLRNVIFKFETCTKVHYTIYYTLYFCFLFIFFENSPIHVTNTQEQFVVLLKRSVLLS